MFGLFHRLRLGFISKSLLGVACWHHLSCSETLVLGLLVDDDGKCLVPMGDELLPAVRLAFEAARNLEKSTRKKKVRKGKHAKIGPTEFHVCYRRQH